jgi:arabinose-5-phosphate isomerase
MTPAPKTASLDLLASAALELISSSSITALLVVEDGMPVGIIQVHDLLRPASPNLGSGLGRDAPLRPR